MTDLVKKLRSARDQKLPLKPYERAILRYEDLRDHFAKELSNLCGVVEDVDKPFLSIKVVRKEDGAFLVIATRDDDLTEQVMFGYGDDFWEALLSINKKMAGDRWKKNEPYDPNEKGKKKKAA